MTCDLWIFSSLQRIRCLLGIIFYYQKMAKLLSEGEITWGLKVPTEGKSSFLEKHGTFFFYDLSFLTTLKQKVFSLHQILDDINTKDK